MDGFGGFGFSSLVLLFLLALDGFELAAAKVLAGFVEAFVLEFGVKGVVHLPRPMNEVKGVETAFKEGVAFVGLEFAGFGFNLAEGGQEATTAQGKEGGGQEQGGAVEGVKHWF